MNGTSKHEKIREQTLIMQEKEKTFQFDSSETGKEQGQPLQSPLELTKLHLQSLTIIFFLKSIAETLWKQHYKIYDQNTS